jgi:hypothetical protein
MVLILSIDSDFTTDVVINWLKHYKHEYLRINAGDMINKPIYFSIEEDIITIDNKKIPLNQISVVWYRKFGFYSETIQYKTIFEDLGGDVAYQILRESKTIYDYILAKLETKKWLLNPKYMNLNKLIVLDLANKMGLDIPKTFIINDKKTPYKSIRGKLINYKNGK